MSDSRIAFFECFDHLTEEFRRVISEDIKDAFKRPYHNALEAMLKVHWANREESFIYRFFDRSWLLPISSFLGGIKGFSDQIEDRGVAAAAADLFHRMGVRLRVNLAPEVRSILEKRHPLLLVGEHPSRLGFDFFAVAASLGNFWRGKVEPRLIAVPSAMGICPGLRCSAFPVVTTREKEIKKLTVKGGQPEVLAKAWAPTVDRYYAYYITTSSLDEAVNYWLDGGNIVLFPDNGIKGGKWFFGIGRIILEALQRLGAENQTDPHILFFHLKGANDILIANPPFMPRFHLVRVILAGNKRSVTVQYQKFFSLRNYRHLFSGMDKQTLAHYLQQQYGQV